MDLGPPKILRERLKDGQFRWSIIPEILANSILPICDPEVIGATLYDAPHDYLPFFIREKFLKEMREYDAGKSD